MNLDSPALGGPTPPLVTLVVAMRNEEASIGACLQSLLAQSYPADRLEILVYDGASTDRSVEIARATLEGRSFSAVRPNPRITQAAAWNMGIDEAAGEVVGIVSGHAELGSGYVAALVETLERTGAAMVGGPVRAVGTTPVGRAVAVATSTWFGMGGGAHHYADVERTADTVFMGTCRTATYRRFAFDESMVRNQDDELSSRIREAGGRIVCNPAIESTYHVRATWPSLWRQYFAYGFWKVRVSELHPGQVRLRHLVPSALVVTLAGLGLATIVSPTARILLAVVAGAYGLAILASSGRHGRRLGAALVLRLAVTYLILHIAYGTGFVAGLVRRVTR